MKNAFPLMAFLFLSLPLYSQSFESIVQAEFKSEEDYQKQEPSVLFCANYMLDHPLIEEDIKRQASIQFILLWMEGTPDHTFSLGEEFMTLTNNDINLTGMYLAALAKTAIEGKGNLNDEQLKSKSQDLFIDYCANKENKVKKHKAIKKLIKEKNKKED
ncbi:MAG: hypothetical protein AAF985_15775 [Bacteroidota bacterium]